MTLAGPSWLRRSRPALVALALSAAFPVISRADAEPASTEVETLRREVADLRLRDEENRARMAEMEKILRQLLDASQNNGATVGGPAPALPPPGPAPSEDSPAAALDAALNATGPASPESGAPAAASPSDALDQALATSVPPGQVGSTSAPGIVRSNDIWSTTFGGSNVAARLLDISALTNVAVGGSSVGDDEVADLQGGAHDPNENGFTLQQMELALEGAVDPFFTGFANVVFTPDHVELEEAFLTTSSLPVGLQLEGGYFLTEFGLVNPTHAHSWAWLDQPVVNSRIMGGEGLRSVGARLSWLMPTPFFSELHVGVQNADMDDYTVSFMGDEGIGGRPNVARDVDGVGDFLWLGRWNASWDLTGLQGWSALMLGASVLYGPNSTGTDAETWIWGADMKLRWRSPNNFRGWPFVVWQTEVIGRNFRAASFEGGTAVGGGDEDDGHGHGESHDEHGEDEESEFANDLPGDTLHDLGFYTQLLYGFDFRWAAGLRGEFVTGSAPSVSDGVLSPRREDPLRADRFRISPLLQYQPTEFSRLRLQYNYDNSDALKGQDAHTVWFGAEVFYGAHGAHQY